MKVVLTKELMIGNYPKEKGRVIEVTKDYGHQLIREGKAREENFIEKIKKKVLTKKKKHGNN